MNCKKLITGATGFIGQQVIKLEPLSRVVIHTNNNCQSHDSFKIKELNNNTNWYCAFDGVGQVIHLAGLAHSRSHTEDDYRAVNVDGTLRLASDAAKAGVKRFVFVSSIAVNGTKTKRLYFNPSSEARPNNVFAHSKYDAEIGLKKIAEETGLEVVIVRSTLVYGLNAPANFGVLTKLVQKLPFLPFGLTDNKRDFIAVQNLADLLITCANHPDAAGHIFLASDGETVSIKEFTNAIAKGLDKKLIQLPVPVNLMRLVARLAGKSTMAEQLLGDLQVDSTNAKEVLGWTPPYTMEQAMASLLENKK